MTHEKNKSNVNWILLVIVNNLHLLAKLIALCCQFRSQREDPTPAEAIKLEPLILIWRLFQHLRALFSGLYSGHSYQNRAPTPHFHYFFTTLWICIWQDHSIDNKLFITNSFDSSSFHHCSIKSCSPSLNTIYSNIINIITLKQHNHHIKKLKGQREKHTTLRRGESSCQGRAHTVGGGGMPGGRSQCGIRDVRRVAMRQRRW